jgi:hypothetical protein
MNRLLLGLMFFFVANMANAAGISRCNEDYELVGEIFPGELNKIKKKYAECIPSTIYLNSVGGDFMEAMEIGRWIRKNRVIVYVGGDCLSSCVLILAGGNRKNVHGDARIGIHRPYFSKRPSGDIGSLMKKMLIETKTYLSEMNIPEQLAEDIFSTPPEKIKILSKTELGFYRLDQDDIVVSENDSINKASKYGLSRAELMKRESLAQNRILAECNGDISAPDFVAKLGICRRNILRSLGIGY